jgi:toxin-antitoxin system PIN domain toxin
VTTLSSTEKLAKRYLPDVNVLIALSNPGHVGFRAAARWMSGVTTEKLLLCAVTEAGFVRLSAAPQVGGRDLHEAIGLLEEIRRLPSCERLAIDGGWLELIRPLRARLHGYRQVTDALLLGLAVRNNSILVTLDRAIQSIAGNEFATNLLVLE